MRSQSLAPARRFASATIALVLLGAALSTGCVTRQGAAATTSVPPTATMATTPIAALAAPDTGVLTVILVRHAEKAAVPGGDPPLSEAGQARARALDLSLRDAKVSAVITTQYQRTTATAAPLVTRVGGIVPEVVQATASGHPRAVADAVLRHPAGSAVLVVGHSNTIPAIIGALGGPTLPDLCDAEYANMFVLSIPARGSVGTPVLLKATYGAPDAPGAASCNAAGAPAMRQ